MVKPDYNRDYYADLELPSSVDVTEIKKQFKKLALKYHPDRNVGREEEAKEKFLIIQAAHEILTDTTLKAKYDANRKRSAYPGASGIRGNPYQNIARDVADRFGAPPRRNQTPTRPPPTPYSSWGVPPQPKAKEGGNVFDNLRAWDRMRSSSSNNTPTSSTTGANTANTANTSQKTSRPQGRTNPPPPPPRTAFQAARQEAAFGTRKATARAASPVKDEPPAKNQHYSNYHSNVFEETAASFRKQRPASVNDDPLSEQFSETFIDTRQRTPYASHVGEKFDPRGERDSRRRVPDSDEEGSPLRPRRGRSASVGESDSSNRKQDTRPPDTFRPPPAPRFESSASARYSPRPVDPTSAPATSTNFPFPPSPNPPVNDLNGDGSRDTRKNRTPKVYAQPGEMPHSLSGLFDPPPSKPAPPERRRTGFRSKRVFQNSPLSFSELAGSSDSVHAYAGGTLPRGYARPSPTTAPVRPNLQSYADIYSRRVASSFAPPTWASELPSKKRKYGQRDSPSGEPTPSGLQGGVKQQLLAQLRNIIGKEEQSNRGPPRDWKHTNTVRHSSFAVPDDDDDDDEIVRPSPAVQQARFMRNSTDNINTRFVAEEKTGEHYQFSAGGTSSANDSDDSFLRAKQRSRSAPRGRKSPEKMPFQQPEAFSAAPQQADFGQKSSAFNPEQWAEKIGPHNFVPPPVTRQSTSPTRQGRPIKKPKPVRMTAGTAGMVEDEDTSGEDRPRQTPAAPNIHINGAPSPNAMDIDPPPQEPTVPTTSNARPVNVEPSKPEWRAGDLNSTKTEAAVGNGLNVPKPTIPVAGSEDTEDVTRPVFPEFQQQEPFAPASGGLGGWGDLKMNLPFDSKPATKLPFEVEKPKGPPVEVPSPPVCPRVPPALAIKDLKPSPSSWVEYVRGFEMYLQLYAEWEKRITDHFGARKRAGESKGKDRFSWVNMRGDQGIQKYVQDLEQDKFIRQKWMAAAEAHELRVREFAKHRDRMKQHLETA
ncbi:DnaJ-related protein rsp1 [Echria macrotheca]|uniref:DnaJ-related protein rsp1 n=1 Tax=Echria macrotheca TaxID=438768 RepID=A0AAJ0F8D8_9PEZI|nr:DnaJ-related protein rsp1 [Echria macrotheca]